MFTWLVLILFSAAIYAHPTTLMTRGKKFLWGTIGDSYASGVSYSKSSEFDGNQDGCHRLLRAYAAQLKNDWPEELDGEYFEFAACSGAQLVHMARAGQFEGLKPQMDQLHEDMRLVTMQAGGNNAGFFAIARDCIYHSELGKDYKMEYPGEGPCTDAISWTDGYIGKSSSSNELGLAKDLDNTIADILRHPNAQGDEFKLYVLGYAHFFNVDSPDSDWCSDHSFSVSPEEWLLGGKPKLTQTLRSKMNELTSRLNDKIKAVVEDRNDPKLVYVSITEGFDNHRFCEKGGTWWSQYEADGNVWFWNARPSAWMDEDSYEDAPLYVDSTLGQKRVDEDWAKAYNSTDVDEKALEAFDWSDLLQFDKHDDVIAPLSGTDGGSSLRPFHPQTAGHTAIKEILRAQILADFS